jgi:hypothetical protein
MSCKRYQGLAITLRVAQAKENKCALHSSENPTTVFLSILGSIQIAKCSIPVDRLRR